MPTYVYETIPKDEFEEPVVFEVWQLMSEKPLTSHPETGQPVKRAITAGLTIVSKKGGCCRSSCGCR